MRRRIPRQELVEQLLQYKMYKYMAEELKERQTDSDMVLLPGTGRAGRSTGICRAGGSGQACLTGVTLSRLNEVFRDVMKRQNDKIDPVRSKFGKIEKEEVSLSERLDYIHEYAEDT